MRKLLAFNIGKELWIKEEEGVGTGVETLGTLGNIISNILPNIYIFAGVVLFILLIFGGLTVIINAGKDNPEETAKGQKAITAAVIGFLIIFCSYWIIQIIKTITGVDILSPGGIPGGI